MEAVDRDSQAFAEVMAAYRRPKEERAPFIEQALHGATEVPLQMAERVAQMLVRIEALQIPAKFQSDLVVAKVLGAAAKTGALENVHINLASIQDDAFRAFVESRLRALNA